MSAKSNHHVIPQFVLRRFADSANFTRQHSREDNASFLIPVRHATAQTHLYTIDDKGEKSEVFENTLARFEDMGARAVGEIVDKKNWPLHVNNRTGLSAWMAAQYLRTPRSRKVLDSQMGAIREHMGTLQLADVRRRLGGAFASEEVMRQKWSEVLDYYKPSGHQQPPNAQARWFASLISDAAKSLFYRDWVLVRYDTPSFIASDNLIIALGADGRIHGVTDFLAAPQIFMPLDRWTAIVLLQTKADDESVRDVVAPQPPQFAEQLNRFAASNCDLAVFEHPDDALFPSFLDLPRVRFPTV